MICGSLTFQGPSDDQLGERRSAGSCVCSERFTERSIANERFTTHSMTSNRGTHDRTVTTGRRCVGLVIHCGLGLRRRTPKITRLPPRDFDFRKRPIGNSSAFFCSALRLCCQTRSSLCCSNGIEKQPVACTGTAGMPKVDSSIRADCRSCVNFAVSSRAFAHIQLPFQSSV